MTGFRGLGAVYGRQAENSQFNRHLRVARPFISPYGFRSAFSRTRWILYK